MTINEITYLYVGIIVSFFFTAAVTNLSRHKFRFPHRYIDIVLFWWGASYIFYLPCFREFYEIPWVNFVRDLYYALCCPIVLICFNMLTRVKEKRLFVHSIVSYTPPFVAVSLIRCFGGNRIILIALLVVIIVETLYWYRLNINYIKSYNENLRNYVSNTQQYSNRWLRAWVDVIALVVILWSIRAMFEPASVATSAITWGMVAFDICFYVPGFFLFSVLYNNFLYFDEFLAEDKPSATAVWNEEQKQTLSEGEEFSMSQDTIVDTTRSATDAKVFQGLKRLIDTDYFLNPHLTMRDLAHEIGVHRYQLVGYLQANDITFYDFVQVQRLRHAADLLRDVPDVTPEEVSSRCGFSSYRVMAKAFEKSYECSPEEYRQENNTTLHSNF